MLPKGMFVLDAVVDDEFPLGIRVPNQKQVLALSLGTEVVVDPRYNTLELAFVCLWVDALAAHLGRNRHSALPYLL